MENGEQKYRQRTEKLIKDATLILMDHQVEQANKVVIEIYAQRNHIYLPF